MNMRRGGGRAVARAADDEGEERIVYRDLAVPDGSRSLLFSPDAPVRPKTPQKPGGDVREKPRDLFGRQALFRLDASDEEGGGEEEEEADDNPFAALLEPSRKDETEGVREVAREVQGPSSSQEKRSEELSEGLERLVAVTVPAAGSSSQQLEVKKTVSAAAKMKQKESKRLSFEAADSRPARWGVRSSQPSARDTKNRRKSLNTLKRRSLDVKDAGSSRRWSASAALQNAQSSQRSDVSAAERRVAKKPRLSDVLHRATTLSQQKLSESFVGETQTGYSQPLDDDSILDTDRQMKAESFTPHIFSPSKPTNISNSRRSKSEDGIVSKIRGEIGEALRRAIRRSNRETTLLRSDGQSLLQNQSVIGAASAVERIQDRGYVTLRITGHARSAQDRLFECMICSFTPDVKDLCPTPTIANEQVQVVLSAHTSEFVKPAPGVMLKIYEPFSFVPKVNPVGLADRRTTWFLVSTHLAEVVNSENTSGTEG